MEQMPTRTPKIYYVSENIQWHSAKIAARVGDVIEVYVLPPHGQNLTYVMTETGLKGPDRT